MSITPLCKQLSSFDMCSAHVSKAHRYQSPDNFASALRPLCPQWSQRLVRRACAVPLERAQDIALLKVRPFKYPPKSGPRRPVEFRTISNRVIDAKKQSFDDPESRLQYCLAHPEFLEALAKRSHRQSMRNRRHTYVAKPKANLAFPVSAKTADQPSRQAKRRSLPFDEEKDLDPWMLFHELQHPNSALRNDSSTYVRQVEEVAAAHEQRYRARRGSPLTAAELVDLTHMTFGLGKYASPSTMPTPESISQRSYSPMVID